MIVKEYIFNGLYKIIKNIRFLIYFRITTTKTKLSLEYIFILNISIHVTLFYI